MCGGPAYDFGIDHEAADCCGGPGGVTPPEVARGVAVSRRRVLWLGAAGTAAAVLAGCGQPRNASGPPPPVGDTLPPDAALAVPEPHGGAGPSVTAAVPPPDPQTVTDANVGRLPVEWGVDVTGVHRQLVDAGTQFNPTLALTFDACGGPAGSEVDTALVDLLEAEQVPATVFLNQRWIETHRGLTDRLAESPLFEIGNHGSRHLPLSVTGRSAYGIAGTTDAADAAAEVWSNHELLTSVLGFPPKWFRSGTAHYDDVAASIAIELGAQPVGFTTNGDYGATASPAAVAAELVAAPAGGIVLAHMNQPAGGTAAGVAQALSQLRSAGVRLVTLSDGGGTRP